MSGNLAELLAGMDDDQVTAFREGMPVVLVRLRDDIMRGVDSSKGNVSQYFEGLKPDEIEAFCKGMKDIAQALRGKIIKDRFDGERGLEERRAAIEAACAEYDAGLFEMPYGNRKLLQDMSDDAGWVESDGELVGVFDRRVSGHRCIWSCKWATVNGVVQPGDMMPLEYMDTAHLLAELRDIAGRRPGGKLAILEAYNDADWRIAAHPDNGRPFSDADVMVANFKTIIQAHRSSYNEYVCHWSLPKFGVKPTGRPGWASNEDISRLIKVAV